MYFIFKLFKTFIVIKLEVNEAFKNMINNGIIT